MSKKSKIQDEDIILKNVKEILNLKEKTEKDEALQMFVKFIFTKEFKEDKITLPVKRRDKDSFNFIKKYIELIYLLFQLNQKERTELYDTKPILVNNYEIGKTIQILNQLVERKYVDVSGLAGDDKNLLNKIKLYLLNLVSHQPNTLFSQIDKYHFYFILYTPSICVVKLLLYSILRNKFPDILNKFSYCDFCPDLNNEVCQNLITLFFENIKDEKKELLFIFALLIFQFQRIFQDDKYKKISKYILQYAAKKTYKYLQSLGLQCQVLFESTYTKFLYYLEKTIFELEQKKSRNNGPTNLSNNHNSQFNNLDASKTKLLPKSNEIHPIPFEKNNSNIKDGKDSRNYSINNLHKEDNSPLDLTNENKMQLVSKSHEIHQENNINKKEDQNYNNSSIGNLSKDEQFLEENKTLNKNTLLPSEKNKKEENIEEINLKNINILSLPVINISQNEGKINNAYSSVKSIIPETKKIDTELNNSNKISEPLQKSIPQNNDVDTNSSNLKTNNEGIFNLSIDQISSLTSQQLLSLIVENQKKQEQAISKALSAQKLDLEIEFSKKLSAQKLDLEIEFSKKLSDQKLELEVVQKKLSEQKQEFSEEIKNLKHSIGKIQTRFLANNFLKIFKDDLSNEEKSIIKNDSSKRGKVTLDALKRKYSQYLNNKNFKILAEIVEKTGLAVNQGNSLAHTLNLQDYAKEIEMFKEKRNITMIDDKNMEKVLFLIIIGISDDTFSNCYDFTVEYLDKEMKMNFLRLNHNIDKFVRKE